MDNTLLGWLFIGGVILLWYVASNAADVAHEPQTASRKNQEDDPQRPGVQSTNSTSALTSPTFLSGVPLDPSGPWAKLRDRVFARDKFQCIQCGSSESLTVDHIKELSLGGGNDISNLRTLCKDCHEERHLRRFLDQGFDANDNYGEDIQLTRKIAAIDGALKKGTTIAIRYKDRFGVRSYRVVHPREIWRRKKSRKIYITAYDELERGERIFRVSRLEITNTKTSRYLDTPVRTNEGTKWSGFRNS